ncbi:2,3-bisphosphoglycerate-independent phosphoglycerate mutase [Clostridium sp. 19966]|uniref:2,3-bisphosphoglycerate-independent phosphoglycerate mutase n=1 Tax=Clostridium sp. 19966 TaxID=2768166 RepID=UPI0028DE5648|nr:2,3-bisphosphoglycerate-independent phosphoglycerate mutase [Clostridium sp. 19966]MDT8717893.1 2,3-bisphosphoglycerate-independent phosphoglycerate mutase [Clostridium sp. 19966]
MGKRPVMLMILDGLGLTDRVEGNAVREANKPNFDSYMKKYYSTQLDASGMEVGLPKGQMGNSEVGHLNIGAGRIIYQELTRITKEIEDEAFYKNEVLNSAIDSALEKGTSLHLLGLLSNGGVHSHIDHLKALLKLSKQKGLSKVYIHAFMDGRDTPPTSGKDFIQELEDYIKEIGVGKIATISGRYYAMDRDKRWERVQLAYDALVKGKGEVAESAVAAIEKSYSDNKKDEFVLPTVITEEGKPIASIKNNDSVIFFNFRPDRARELTRAINDKKFDGFPRETLKLKFATMTQYDVTIEGVDVAYHPQSYKNTIGEFVSSLGLKQLRMAETEKYAHVTFFFNGGVEEPNPGEERIVVPSPKVATYDLKPEMSAYELTEELLSRIDSDKYDLIIVNYANPDMVGHTGVLEAAKKAVETVDICAGKVVEKVLSKGGAVFITADHGNAEQMIDYSTGAPMTSHTTDPVPFIFVADDSREMRAGGKLSDIAPTLLEEMGITPPAEMTGESLIKA